MKPFSNIREPITKEKLFLRNKLQPDVKIDYTKQILRRRWSNTLRRPAPSENLDNAIFFHRPERAASGAPPIGARSAGGRLHSFVISLRCNRIMAKYSTLISCI
ncbi:hypothetical protein EVAR_344_1 [Eumeta japonica]|uniref:Uncharacterized protein n=1 Tax=Eumeta variegata TaxID=151549 RepID=A0A4C1S9X4_EUMVA|nr:hypothetical protein EVAR_344_1 [Eumeta japonica]